MRYQIILVIVSVVLLGTIFFFFMNGGSSIFSPSDETTISVPKNLVITAVSSSQISLSWEPSAENVTGYKIFRDGFEIASVTGTSYQDTGLSANETYTYSVAAYDASGDRSDLSPTVSTTTQSATTSSGGGGGGGGSGGGGGGGDNGGTPAENPPSQNPPAENPPPENLPSEIVVTGSCLDQNGSTTTISGNQTSVYNEISLPANTKIDARTASWNGLGNTPIKAGGDGMCWSGGEVIGTFPDGTSWDAYHDAYAFIVKSSPNSTVEGLTIYNYGDGINLDPAGSEGFIVKDNYISYIHDDCFSNDFGANGIIDDNLFDGCYVGYSSRSFTTVQNYSNRVVTIQNNLWRLQDMPTGYGNNGPGHGKFWKMDSAYVDPKLALHDNIFRLDTPANCCGNYMIPPPERLASCSNNVMIWLGSGAFPETVPSCFTLMTGQEGLDYWNNAVSNWTARH